MTRVVIEPTPLELGLNRLAYDGLIADLEQAGFEVELREPIEERFGLPEIPPELASVTFWVAQAAGQEALTRIVEAFIRRMKRSRTARKKPPPRRPSAVFKLDNGEEWARVPIPERED